jgi:NAD(P)-dependent dehydrogenase (short-subunit alcohol dehydrogenase family)
VSLSRSENGWPWVDAPVCLVTGSTRGLGHAIAAHLVGRGASVIVTGRDPEQLGGAVDELGSTAVGRATALRLDVAEPASVAASVEAVRANHGRLDILVNNAAAYVDWGETATTADLGRSAEVLQVNLYGAWRMLQAYLPLLAASKHPRVVNMASGAGSHGDGQFGLASRGAAAASYGVSKAALLALTTTIAAELADAPIIVNAVDPHLTATWPGAENLGARPTADSVPGVIWAATLPDDGPRGGFFRDGQAHPW